MLKIINLWRGNHLSKPSIKNSGEHCHALRFTSDFSSMLRLIKNGAQIEGLKSNLVKQFSIGKFDQQRARVEVRGKKMRGLPLYKLDSLPNRFERFHFCDLDSDGIELPPYIEDAFLALCRQSGVKAALSNFKNTEWVRKVNAYYRTREAGWWRPEPLWQEACNAIREIGLFPDLAFDEPKLRGRRSDFS